MSRPGGRGGETRRGRSGLHRARWWATPTRGDPRDSATENRPPSVRAVRVKRWCKRPPAFRVTGTARQTPPGARSRRGACSSRERSRAARPSSRVDRTRSSATAALDGWSPTAAPRGARGQNPAYRPAHPSGPQGSTGIPVGTTTLDSARGDDVTFQPPTRQTHPVEAYHQAWTLLE